MYMAHFSFTLKDLHLFILYSFYSHTTHFNILIRNNLTKENVTITELLMFLM